MEKAKAVILVSGGIDSSTVLAMISQKSYEIHAITFNYSQRHHIEIDKVKSFIKDYDIKHHKIINIDLASFGGSALTDHNIDVPKYNKVRDLQDEIPITYVPARNIIFLSYALAYAEVVGAFEIFMGVHAEDYSNYPDCRPEFITSFEETANLATKLAAQGNKVKIHTPVINMTKAKIIQQGISLGVDYSKTISCYDPTEQAESCGSCHACLLRLEGFAQNNIQDPAIYISRNII